MMEILIVTDTGCEDAAALEVQRHVKAKPIMHQNLISIKGTLDDAITLGYRMQTARRVMIPLIAAIQELEELEHLEPDPAIVKIIPESATFKVEGEILSLSVDDTEAAPITVSQQLVEDVADWAHAHLNRTVKLGKPDVVIFALQTPERIYIGLDVVGKSLAKREWRIMLSRRSLKSTVAAATVLYSGAKPGELILDPFADDGSIVTEAALLLSNTSPRLFDNNMSFERFEQRDWSKWKKADRKEIQKIVAFASNLQEMKAIRTNSKLAGVEKELHTTKVTVDWVDAKIEEKSVDRIITAPMPSGKSVTPQQVAKLNEQLFYQAEYVLKKGKTVTAISEKPDELLSSAEKYKFKETERRKILMGKRLMTIVTFKK